MTITERSYRKPPQQRRNLTTWLNRTSHPACPLRCRIVPFLKIKARRLNHPAARYVFSTGQVSPLALPGRSTAPASTDTGRSRGQGR